MSLFFLYWDNKGRLYGRVGKEADAVLAPSDAVRREMEWRRWAPGWIRDGRGGKNAASSTSGCNLSMKSQND